MGVCEKRVRVEGCCFEGGLEEAGGVVVVARFCGICLLSLLLLGLVYSVVISKSSKVSEYPWSKISR